MMKKELDIFDKPQNVKVMMGLFYVVLVALILVDIFYVEHHAYFPFAGKAGFYAAFGFVACVLVITISKILRYFLIRGNDYYEEE